MAQTSTTTKIDTTVATQQGTQLVVTSQSDKQNVGEFVTGITLQPYIAKRIISFIAYNMRPNQRMHIFFDSVLVDQYCAPAVKTSGKYSTTVTNTADYRSIPKDGDWGTSIFSDENGIVAGQFNVPEGTFRTGERTLQITDVDSLVLGSSAYTTMSSATFVASNLSVTKQALTLTTITPELSYVPVTNTYVTTNTTVTVKKTPDKIRFTVDTWEPIAQSLTINTPDKQSGIFATSLDIFFKQKPVANVNGITVYLTEMDNGYPDGSRVLPFSTVHKNWNDVTPSNDATVGTKFVFESPVFLANETQYAFIVKPDSNDPDYQVWTANLGDLDVRSKFQVSTQPLIGTAFYGATTRQWTALQTEYIKFILNRASFTNAAGRAIFNNSNTDYVKIFNVQYVNSSVSILPGDYIYESENNTINSISGTVNTSVYGIVDNYDDVKGIVYTDNSTGNFFQNTDKFIQIHRFANDSVRVPNVSTVIAHANSGTLYDPGIDLLVTRLATISPPGTSIKYNYTGTSNSALNYDSDTKSTPVTPGIETEFLDKERVVASRTNEIEYRTGSKSFTLEASLTTDTEFVSPVIDLVRNQQLAVKNDVDPVSFQYNEFFSSGSTKSKYISKIITLAPGQDAEDLQLILSAFRPVGSDVQVWVRFLNKEDPDSITRKVWTPLYNSSPDLYSDPSNPKDFREFVYGVGSYYTMLQLSGTTTSTNNSTTITGVNTLFNTELQKGWYINMRSSRQSIGGQTVTLQEQTRKIVDINSATQLTIESPFVGNYSSNLTFLVPPPTTAWLSDQTKDQLTGTVSVNTTNNSIFGIGTEFTQELKVGNIINAANDSQVIVSISNSSHLSVGTPWSSTESGINAYSIAPLGITYLNNNLNLYSTFNQFQIKIILQANDSSKVPILDDLRVLAMQL